MAIAPDALDRWTYRKDGMDYGPFSTRDILDLLRKRALTPEMEVCNRKTRKWLKVSEVPRFAAFLAAEAEETKRQEIEREVTALERTITARRRMPALLLLVVGAVVASVFYILLRPAAPVLAGYPAAFFRNPAIERLPLYLANDIARMKAAALPKPVEAPKPVRKVVRRTTAGAEVTEIGPGSADMGIEVDLSDSAPVEGGRTLSGEDLDQVQRRASPALIRCFRDEAARRPGFRGGTVSLYLLNSGSVKVSRVSTNPAPSPELAACARGATGGIHVPAYTGPAQVMELPIYVSEVR